jgi:2,3-dihydroxybiphenyl 1,2-dioxygenase
MTDPLQLAYVGVEVPDPAPLGAFLGDVIGLVPGEPSPDAATTTWRNDDRAQRVIVQPGPANDAVFVGIEAPDDTTFDATVARLAAAGHAVAEGDPDTVAARRVERLAMVPTPWGIPVELVRGLAAGSTPFASDLIPGGFLTGDLGFGHVVFATTAFDESAALLVDGLGFARTDSLRTELAPGVELEVGFFHCNPRHHTIALARAPFAMPQTLHHLMVEVNERDDVGAAFDRAWATDLAIPNGLGRHDNDRMFSFYVAGPAGFLVEVGFGGRTVGADWDDDRVYDRISAWGHQPLRG